MPRQDELLKTPKPISLEPHTLSKTDKKQRIEPTSKRLWGVTSDYNLSYPLISISSTWMDFDLSDWMLFNAFVRFRLHVWLFAGIIQELCFKQ